MMKKIVLVIGLMFSAFFAGNYVNAQTSDYNVAWEAVNVSKNNVNAVVNGARPGDVVRYEVVLTGGDGPGTYNPQINVSDILSKATLIKLGGGTLTNDILSFPQELCVGCEEQKFSFFVRTKDTCMSGASMKMSLNSSTVSVPFECELVKSGPNLLLFLSVGLMLTIMGYFILSLKRDKIN